MAQSCEVFCATCRLSARRSASGMLVAPDRRISSCVMTWIAEAVPSSFWACRATEVTSTFMRSSTFSCFKSPKLGDPLSAASRGSSRAAMRRRTVRARGGGSGRLRAAPLIVPARSDDRRHGILPSPIPHPTRSLERDAILPSAHPMNASEPYKIALRAVGPQSGKTLKNKDL